MRIFRRITETGSDRNSEVGMSRTSRRFIDKVDPTEAARQLRRKDPSGDIDESNSTAAENFVLN